MRHLVHPVVAFLVFAATLSASSFGYASWVYATQTSDTSAEISAGIGSWDVYFQLPSSGVLCNFKDSDLTPDWDHPVANTTNSDFQVTGSKLYRVNNLTSSTYEVPYGSLTSGYQQCAFLPYSSNGTSVDSFAILGSSQYGATHPGYLVALYYPSTYSAIGDYAFRASPSSGVSSALRRFIYADLGEYAASFSLGASSFYDCAALEKVDLPSYTESISAGAFALSDGVSASHHLTIAFAGTICQWMRSVTKNDGWHTNRDVTVICSDATINYLANNNESVVFDADATEVEDSTFSNDLNLLSVTMGASITRIGKYSFKGCTSLSNVDLSPITKTYRIDVNAFYNDTSLKNLALNTHIAQYDGKSFATYGILSNAFGAATGSDACTSLLTITYYKTTDDWRNVRYYGNKSSTWIKWCVNRRVTVKFDNDGDGVLDATALYNQA
jgi:hypothetical protein